MKSKRIIRVAAVSLYGALLVLGRPTADALAPLVLGHLSLALLATVFLVAAVLGLWAALGAGPWWRRIAVGLMSWLAVLVLYFVGCANSRWTEGDLFAPASIYTHLVTMLVMGLARRGWGCRMADVLASRELMPWRRQFTLVQLLIVILVVGACCGLLQATLRETRFPDWLSPTAAKVVVLQGGVLKIAVLFGLLAAPWMLAAFAGWRAIVLAVGATLATVGATFVTVGGVPAHLLGTVLHRAPPADSEIVLINVVGALIPTVAAYILLLGFRCLGFQMRWSSTKESASVSGALNTTIGD